MAQVIIEDLDSEVIEKLQVLAEKNARSLQVEYSQRELMPFDDLQKQFQEALREAGYNSQKKIVNLVQEIKREIAKEHQKNL